MGYLVGWPLGWRAGRWLDKLDYGWMTGLVSGLPSWLPIGLERRQVDGRAGLWVNDWSDQWVTCLTDCWVGRLVVGWANWIMGG